MPVVDLARVVAALPGYTVGEQLGAGTSGLVLMGRHQELDREVAIKVLSAATTGPAAGIDFRAEARLLSRLDHPHIVRIYDYVGQGNLCLLVMELLAGGTLKAQRLSAEGACAVGLAVADALTRAHTAGVLHRDVKPDNILFTTTGQPKITDFGIAKILDGTQRAASQIVGTPRYMAPEQITGSPLGPPVDLYALAVVLYEQLTGTPLFDPALTLPELFRHHCEVPPPPPAGVPEPVARVIVRALAKNPADRHPSAHDFALDLAHAATHAYGPHWTTRSGIVLHVPDQLRDPSAPEPRPATPPPPPAFPTTARLGAAELAAPPVPASSGTSAEFKASPAPETTPVASSGTAAKARARRRWLPAALVAVTIAATLGTGGFLVARQQSSAAPTPQPTGTGDSGAAPAASQPAGPLVFDSVEDVVADRSGNLYLVDQTNNRVLLRTKDGEVTLVAGTGQRGSAGDGGPATEATLNSPVSLALDRAGNIYVADQGNNRIRRVDTAGTITTFAGTGDAFSSDDDGGPASQAGLTLSFTADIAVDAKQNLFICESTTLRFVNPAGIIAALPGLSSPSQLAADTFGNLYLTRTDTDQIFRLDANGVVSLFAGTGTTGFSGDGGLATAAQLDFGLGDGDLAVDAAGNVYVADEGNHRIRRIGTDGIISTFAGTGPTGAGGDGLPATQARLYSPGSVEVDGSGNVYIGELGNSVIRKVDAQGIITTLVE